ncbi:16S rRNA pseudouridine516 synthase [Ruminococcus sp. YE71]|uniref:pseudouridine synthase n=1 Tax=unclassified Ruminococcus TaxID=2608920 RepID=UPI0008863581|nr:MULTISPECIES: pseudouridine synthase [unclassified Ruminococcus]SDA20244.1 16S rRNA pseudouridine516 synthase [Ruminococcus sp. YE78]SFW32106.1 16S rRNA pseudouridine516 synthase [Ruminococcus sp. YE71]
MRIDKFISSQRTDLSRSDVKKLIKDGRVSADGLTVRTPDYKVSENSSVTVDGSPITFKRFLYIMLNKPQGYVCSTKEGKSPTVLELVPPELRRKDLFPAGRLDKDTEGFVLITDDGQLAHDMLAPSKHVPKTYFVRLRDPYDPSYEIVFTKGVTIDGGELCLPAELTPDDSDPFACTLIIREGKFHQVKRMFESVGNKVVYLKRVRIGGLDLDPELPLGSCLEIMHKDVEKIIPH